MDERKVHRGSQLVHYRENEVRRIWRGYSVEILAICEDWATSI